MPHAAGSPSPPCPHCGHAPPALVLVRPGGAPPLQAPPAPGHGACCPSAQSAWPDIPTASCLSSFGPFSQVASARGNSAGPAPMASFNFATARPPLLLGVPAPLHSDTGAPTPRTACHPHTTHTYTHAHARTCTRARRYVCARARTHTRLLSHCMFLFWGFPPRERELAERGASGRAGHAAGPRSSPPSGALRLGAVGWGGMSDVAGAWSPVVKGLAVWVPRVRLFTAWAVSGTKNRSHPGGNHL